ncbi:MAG: TIM barrel protein [Crenarchaeota archaeon]|nr:TIM barrel protein [Thermoproteota archaeon]MDW8033620.1 TIM barrel protein [Nitrososphaerota archaeon]
MTKSCRIGPAGFPLQGPHGASAMEYLRKIGLDAMEYQAVRSIRIGRKPASEIGSAASENGILLTLHGPYAINLSSNKKIIRKQSIQRVLKSAEIASWMGAFHLTFHPGYYSGFPKELAMQIQKESLKTVLDKIEERKIRVELGPETTGKPNQFGSLEELIELSTYFDGVRLTLDFAHIHARTGGFIKSRGDYEKILDTVEKSLGSEGMKNLVVHFSEVETTSKGVGERKHHPLGSGYGPDFKKLAEIIVEKGYSFIIVCESPLLEIDALKMKRILNRIK